MSIQNIYLQKFPAVTTTAFLSGVTRFGLSDVTINDRVISDELPIQMNYFIIDIMQQNNKHELTDLTHGTCPP